MTEIFVFGSNLAGRHGRGAAVEARQRYGAVYGEGRGRTGNAYGIPTKNRSIQTLLLSDIIMHIKEFIEYAKENPDLKFRVTKIGCGLAGYNEEDIAPHFKDAPDNCELPENWRV